MGNLLNIWEENKNWCLPLNLNTILRKTKFIIVCSHCQWERFVCYTQAYNILKKLHQRDCRKCLIETGRWKIVTNHLNGFNKKTKGQTGKKCPIVKKRLEYITLFNLNDKELQEERRKKYRKGSHEYIKKRLKTDKAFYAMKLVRNRVIAIIKGKIKKSGKLGCTYEVFKNHIEKQFQPGMTWKNYGKWHIDHIYPLSIAIKESDETFLKACHYTNLQSLWAIDNIKKSNKITKDL